MFHPNKYFNAEFIVTTTTGVFPVSLGVAAISEWSAARNAIDVFQEEKSEYNIQGQIKEISLKISLMPIS